MPGRSQSARSQKPQRQAARNARFICPLCLGPGWCREYGRPTGRTWGILPLCPRVQCDYMWFLPQMTPPQGIEGFRTLQRALNHPSAWRSLEEGLRHHAGHNREQSLLPGPNEAVAAVCILCGAPEAEALGFSAKQTWGVRVRCLGCADRFWLYQRNTIPDRISEGQARWLAFQRLLSDPVEAEAYARLLAAHSAPLSPEKEALIPGLRFVSPPKQP